MVNSVMSGACPGRTPMSPALPGIVTSSTDALTSILSGVTISSSSTSAIELCRGLHLLGRLEHFFDAAFEKERLLGNVVIFAVQDLLEAADSVFDLHVLALQTGKLLGHEEGLREKALNLAGTRHRQLLFFAEFVDAEDGDDVLQVLVALQDFFHRLGGVVVLLADDARIENARGGGEGIDGRIDAELGGPGRKHGGGVRGDAG